MDLPLSTEIDSVRAGSLLLASTDLRGDIFQRTVVFILVHDAQGTLGVIINRPSHNPVSASLKEWVDLVASPPVLFYGGPVRTESLLCLGQPHPQRDEEKHEDISATPTHKFSYLTEHIVNVNLETNVHHTSDYLQRIRVFSGYSGWSSGQLAREMSRGAWYVAPGMPHDVFSPVDEDLWALVLRRQGVRASVLATHPINV